MKKGLTLIEGGLSDELDRAAARFVFLAEVSKVLSGALTDEDWSRKLVDLAVPHLADWCTLSLLLPNGEIRRVATAHINPAKARVVERLVGRHPPRPDAPMGIPYVLRTGNSEFVPEMPTDFDPDSALARYTPDRNLWMIVREMGVRSYMTVPMIAHGETLGAIWFATSDSQRNFDHDDLHLAEEVAARAALAFCHILRLRGAREESERLRIEALAREESFANLRHDVRSMLTAARLSAQMLRQKPRERADHDRLVRRIVDSIDRVTAVLDERT